MNDRISAWLESLGLDCYQDAFRQNAITWDVLPELTDEDLTSLGVLLGHRKKLLRAIAELSQRRGLERAQSAAFQFGGHGGRTLRTGDVLHLGTAPAAQTPAAALPAELIPRHGTHWEIGVLYGPHGAPDFFTDADIDMFFTTDWKCTTTPAAPACA